MKRIIITLLVLALAGYFIVTVLQKNKAENEAKTMIVSEKNAAVVVKTADVMKKPIDLNFSSNGNFISNRELNVSSETGGRITSINVKEGSRVSAGQNLATIDAEYSNIDVKRSEDALAKLKTDQARLKASFETGGVTQSQLDEIDLAIRNTENQLKQAKRKLSDAYIKAPISGVINKKFVEIGTYVNTGTALFEVVDVSKLKLKVNVNESQVSSIKEGDKVKIYSNVFPEEKFTGTISFISVKADNTLNFPVEITVDNTNKNQLRAGMYGTAVFEFPEQAPSILVPRTSFIGSVNSNQVYILTQDTTAKIRNVIPGKIIGDQVEIISGIEEGETIITHGQINLSDGVKVEPLKN